MNKNSCVPATPEERTKAIVQEIQAHIAEIARLSKELDCNCPQRPSGMFKKNALTKEQFKAALVSMGKL